MPGARCARSLACSVKNTRVSHHGHTGFTRHSPRNGFNGLFRALPGDRACLPPSPALLLTDLTPASGRQDHTTSPSASALFVTSAARVHRIPPRVRDDREPPPLWDETARMYNGFDFGKTEIFFRSGLDNAKAQAVADLPVGQISPVARMLRSRSGRAEAAWRLRSIR